MRNGSGQWRLATMALLACASLPRVAHAGGFEYAGTGTRALARGGAFVAGANDPMAVMLNPSNLAGPVKGVQAHLSLAGMFNNVCFSRDGTYTDDPTQGPGYRSGPALGSGSTIYGPFSGYSTVTQPTVCNGVRASPVPEFALTWRVNRRVGLGFGLVVPTASGFLSYGGTHDGHAGTVPSNQSPTGYIPAPSRYMLTGQNLLLVYPTISIGVDVIPNRLRLGASFASGIASVDFKTFSQPLGGENFGTDLYTRLHAKDNFIPRVTVSATGTIIPGLEIAGTFTYQGDIKATGHANLTGAYNYDPSMLSATDKASQNIQVNGASIMAHQPWQAYLAMRYRKDLTDQVTRARRFNDDIENERWDVEAVFGFENNARVDQFNIQLYDPTVMTVSPQLTVAPGFTAGVPSSPLPLLHRWKNQFVLRVGGDYAIVPGKFLWSGGFSYDTNGVSKGYAQLDFQPFRRFGLHTGFVVRVGRTDISFAAVHFFQQTMHTTSLSACPSPTTDPSTGYGSCTAGGWGVYQTVAFPPGTIVNSGTIRSGVTTLSLGVTFHFI